MVRYIDVRVLSERSVGLGVVRFRVQVYLCTGARNVS